LRKEFNIDAGLDVTTTKAIDLGRDSSSRWNQGRSGSGTSFSTPVGCDGSTSIGGQSASPCF